MTWICRKLILLWLLDFDDETLINIMIIWCSRFLWSSSWRSDESLDPRRVEMGWSGQHPLPSHRWPDAEEWLCKDNNPIIVRRESVWMILESWRPSPVVTFNAFGRFFNLLPWQKLYLGACYWRCVIWLKSMQVQSVSPMTTMSKVYGKRIIHRLLFPAMSLNICKWYHLLFIAMLENFAVWLLSKVYEVTIWLPSVADFQILYYGRHLRYWKFKYILILFNFNFLRHEGRLGWG